MSSHPIELILLKQWASYIAIPMWITDAEGNLLFYNEPAESILGHRFEEAGEINAQELAETYATRDLDDLTRSSAVHTTGQSGHIFARHYFDQNALWLVGEAHEMRWSRAQVVAGAGDTLTLIPKRAPSNA